MAKCVLTQFVSIGRLPLNYGTEERFYERAVKKKLLLGRPPVNDWFSAASHSRLPKRLNYRGHSHPESLNSPKIAHSFPGSQFT